MTRSVLAMFCLTFLAGCSSFGRDYKAALSRPAQGIEGAWSGTWASDGGHTGALQCVLTKLPQSTAGQTSYRAQFQATFWKIFTGHYDVILTGKEANDGAAHLSGDHDLGKLAGGVYHYEAQVTPANFDATYACPKDKGKFVMTRPAK